MPPNESRDSSLPPQDSPDQSDSRSVLVKNLSFQTSPYKLRRVFEEFGTIRDVYLPQDYDTKRPRGFGFVEFVNSENALNATSKLDGVSIDGNKLICMIAQDRRKSADVMRTLYTRHPRYHDGPPRGYKPSSYGRSSPYPTSSRRQYRDSDGRETPSDYRRPSYPRESRSSRRERSEGRSYRSPPLPRRDYRDEKIWDRRDKYDDMRRKRDRYAPETRVSAPGYNVDRRSRSPLPVRSFLRERSRDDRH